MFAAVAALTVGAVGCSPSHPSHTTTSTTATAAESSAPYAVPKHAAGELARYVIGPHASRGSAGEATPKRGVTYDLTVACVATGSARPSVSWQIRVAHPKSNRVVTSGTMPCDGQVNIDQVAALPPHPIEVELTWSSPAIVRGYAVVAPA